MADDAYLRRLQENIDYSFQDVFLLKKALIAPGAEGAKEAEDKRERDKYEGNRILAQLGESIIEFLVLDKAHSEEDAMRSAANDILKSAVSKESRAERAKLFEIDTHIRLSDRLRGKAARNTLSLAVSAIIGAVWKDSADISVARRVLERFGIVVNKQDQADFITPSSQQETLPAVPLPAVPSYRSDSFDAVDTTLSLPITIENDTGHRSPPERLSGVLNYDLRTNHSLSLHSTDSDGNNNGGFSPVGLSDFSTENLGEVFEDENNYSHISNDEAWNQRWDSNSPSHDSIELPSINPLSIYNVPSLVLRASKGSLRSQYVTDETASPSRSQTGTAEAIKDRRTTQGRPKSTSDTNPKKRKPVVKFSTPCISKLEQLEQYIMLEQERCRSFGLPAPETGFDLAIKQASDALPRDDEFITDLRILYLAIASSESLANLHEIVREQRRSLKEKQSRPGRDLSPVERIEVIEGLGRKRACASLQTRCHTYQLYVDNSAGSRKTSDGFVNDTMQSISRKATSQIGNPNNLEDSQVSKLIMNELYPKLQPGDIAYRKKSDFVRNLRKRGQRYDLLVRKFGYGILGLLPLPVDEQAGGSILNITDNLIFSLSDNLFAWFVYHLDQLLGEYLRETSHAVSEVVWAIFEDELDPSKRYSIELISPSQLVEHPKGSKKLLELISQTYDLSAQPIPTDSST